MSFFDEKGDSFINSIAADDAAFSRRIGFLQSFSEAFDMQAKTWSQFGLEQEMRNDEQEMFKRIREAGAEPPPSLNDIEDTEFFGGGLRLEGFMAGVNSGRYLDAARLYAGDPVNDQGVSDMIAKRDKQLQDLKTRLPNAGIKTYKDMFTDVKARALAAEERAEKVPRTWGGSVGDFFGAAAGSMRPSTDPLNAMTIGVGGGGRSVMTRIATEGGAQGAIETVNQFTGVQENRKLLGLNYGLSQAAVQVATTALGGAAFRGMGEGAGYAYQGGKRWFQSRPGDPAPPPPVTRAPTAPPPVGTARRAPPRKSPMIAQVDPPPIGAAPRAPLVSQLDYEELLGPEVYHSVPSAQTRLGKRRFTEDVASVAEQLESFEGPTPAQVRPSVAADAANARRVVDATGQRVDPREPAARQVDPEAHRQHEKIERQLAAIDEQLDDIATGRVRQATDDTVTQLTDKKQKLQSQLEGSERLLERAEAAARGEWPRTEGQIASPVTPARGSPAPRPDIKTQDGVKVNREETELTAQVQQHLEVMDEALDELRATVGRLLTEGDELHLPDGRSLHLDNDFMVVPTKDGEGSKAMTVRAILKEIEADEDVFKVVQTCSARKTS